MINKASILLLLAVGLGAQTQNTATVEGTVRNLVTGEPIADVRVTLTLEALGTGTTKSATTDEGGRFMIEDLRPGRYTANAVRTLFYRPRRKAGPSALTVAEGERLRGVQIFLSPTAVIAGRVVDERREPLRSVRVEALRREFRDGGRVFVPAANTNTDDRGEYRLFNLQPGTYYIRATQSNLTPLYYPGVADSQTAVPVSLESGNEAGAVDIEMRKFPEYALVFKLGGIPPGSTATFSIRRRGGAANEQLTVRPETLPDNTYRMTLPQGAFDLQAQVYIPGPPRVLTHADVIPVDIRSGDRDLGTVTMRATTTVTGRLVVPEPLPSPLVPERLAVILRRFDTALPMTFSVRGNTGFSDDGSFTIPNVAPGRYQIQMTGLPADTYLISARAGTREVLDVGYTVTGDQQPVELSIGGPGSVGNVEGVVTNSLGQPVSAASVVLVPSMERRMNAAAFRSTTTDQLGSFSIRSVLEGDYKIFAWEDLDSGAYLDPEFLQTFESRGDTIRVRRGSQNSTSVRVIPASP